ncbi:hypothetical protein [Granulicella sp. S190]|uniref:hypothetical protein n=1 Tax=Granulicella sp. S190 TaxID=1747226 RepID=UPI00131C96DD|nr:hypothetical protein [Granulicella sp. S190]
MSDKETLSQYGYRPQDSNDLPVSAPLTTKIPALPKEWSAPETFGIADTNYPVSGPPQIVGESDEEM